MSTAKLLKDLKDFTGQAALYELNPPLKDGDGKEYGHVVVSATNAMFSGPETYIFPANEKGEVVDRTELAETKAQRDQLLTAGKSALGALTSIQQAYQDFFEVMPVAWKTYDNLAEEALSEIIPAIAKAEGRAA